MFEDFQFADALARVFLKLIFPGKKFREHLVKSKFLELRHLQVNPNEPGNFKYIRTS
jgi:hypothetical protein